MKYDILAFGAHPDDVELGCGGTIAKSLSQNKKVAIIDITRGELGTRGSVELRNKESSRANKILGVNYRENLDLKDGFFKNDKKHQLIVISKIREFKPDIVLCNTSEDRHTDHGKGSSLVNDSCFLSGLKKIETFDFNNNSQKVWRPKIVLEYIQWNEVKPDFIFDITGYLEIKLDAVKAYSSQLFNPNSSESETPISSKNFIESVSYRAKNMGRLINSEAGEGFNSRQILSISDLNSFLN
ncbi:MAG: bacillithiol biosynthesis deacetylase BshB1 [Flavobacteriaceae bacterium]|tara:strand:- start:1803 stop:2525 length:723 start_codon:yes stop_codon:yes gene_type:complete